MVPAVVLGGSGMLGHKVFQVLRERYPGTICFIKSCKDDYHHGPDFLRGYDVVGKVDALNLPQLSALLNEIRPRFTINCIGVIKQRSQDPIPSITLNALLPHFLSETCGQWGGRLIHFSTDCVFSGKKGSYTEEDPTDAQDLYGKTKALGEITSPNALTLRTSMIGRELHHFASLLEWLVAQNHSGIRGYKRVLYSGVTTNHLALLVADIIAKHSLLSGIYQVAGSTISKFDLLCKLRDAFRLDIEVCPDESVISDRSMLGDKLRGAIGHVCPSWDELITQLLSDTTPYDSWRDTSI